jgi:hypothetical protein
MNFISVLLESGGKGKVPRAKEYVDQTILDASLQTAQQKKPGSEVASPHAGFLNISLAS